MVKLTKAQWGALAVLADRPVSYATWGDELVTRLPNGIASRATLYAIQRLGLASSRRDGGSTEYRITPAGRAALSERKS